MYIYICMIYTVVYLVGYVYHVYIYIYIYTNTHIYIYIYIIHDLLNTRPYMSHLKAKIRRAVFQTNSTK